MPYTLLTSQRPRLPARTRYMHEPFAGSSSAMMISRMACERLEASFMFVLPVARNSANEVLLVSRYQGTFS